MCECAAVDRAGRDRDADHTHRTHCRGEKRACIRAPRRSPRAFGARAVYAISYIYDSRYINMYRPVSASAKGDVPIHFDLPLIHERTWRNLVCGDDRERVSHLERPAGWLYGWQRVVLLLLPLLFLLRTLPHRLSFPHTLLMLFMLAPAFLLLLVGLVLPSQAVARG